MRRQYDMKTVKVIGTLILLVTIFLGTPAWGDNYTSGGYAGSSLTTGDGNVMIGTAAGGSETTGNYNVIVGQYAGTQNRGCNRNVLVGYEVGTAWDSAPPDAYGTFNDTVAVGYHAGQNILNADWNVFVGSDAGWATYTGGINTCIGYSACYSNSDGTRNTYLGNKTGYNNVSGTHNIFIGDHAGENELGSYRLYIDSRMVGGSGTPRPLIYGEFDNNKLVVSGDLTVTGTITRIPGSAGAHDTFFGEASGMNNTSGSNNTFIGTNAGASNTSGTNNTYIGWQTGMLSTGTGNVFIGYFAGYTTGSNLLYIDGDGGSTPLIFGDFYEGIVQINGSLTVASDERLKKNIEPLHSSLDNVLRLRGVSYEWKDIAHEGRGFGGGKEIGLIAQEVEKVLPELVHTDGNGLKSVSYDRMVPVLIEAVKEHEREIAGQEDQLREKDKRIARLKNALARIEEKLASRESPLKTAALNLAGQ